ncbi:MAG: hypothetical protein ACI9HY_000679 [Planctomycetaceae bacterium]|jgi:hypothetical protein
MLHCAIESDNPITIWMKIMNMIEKQVEMGRALFEINQNTFQELARTSQDNLKKYFELNSTFSKRIPEVTDVTGFVELQREYNETLWTGVKDTTRGQVDMLKTAVEETGVAVRKAFTVETAD